MSEKSEKLYDGITRVGDDLVEAAQDTPKTKKRRVKWMAPVAAALALAMLAGIFLRDSGLTAYAIAEASYPKETQRVDPSRYSGELEHFLTASIPQFLSGTGDGNRVYSPLNVYMALSMLAEVTDGETRAQLLDLLGAEDIETQRERANLLWNANYRDGKRETCLLASSLWLNKDVNFVQNTMDTLAESYYASSYRGEMGSDAFNKALRDWLNEQTGGLLKERTSKEEMSADTVMAIATTVYFRDKWSSEYSEKDTQPDIFHAPDGDTTCDFMYKTGMPGTYCWGKTFSAAAQHFQMYGTMWYILPDEGVSPEGLLEDAEFLKFLASDSDDKWMWENSKNVLVDLSVPKFDVVSDIDLLPGLTALGVTDALDPTRSDYSPMTADRDDIYLSGANHVARVTVDEEGCTAVAYTLLEPGDSAPPLTEEEIDFVLDRPFLFAITGRDGLPLFVGVVNQPVNG